MDNAGDTIGDVDAAWVDETTNQLEFVGVELGLLIGKTHRIPGADAKISTNTITVPYEAAAMDRIRPVAIHPAVHPL